MTKTILLSLMTFCFSLAAQAEGVRFLHELDLGKAYQQFGGPLVGESPMGTIPTVAGVKHPNTVCVHSRSVIKINLKKNGLILEGGIGVADHHIDYSAKDMTSISLVDGKRMFYQLTQQSKRFVGIEGAEGKVDHGKVLFKVVGDGKTLYSKVMRQGDAMESLKLEIKTIETLDLIVEDGGDGNSGDFAYWINTSIKYFEIPPVTVSPEYVGSVGTMSAKTKEHLRKQIDRLQTISQPLEQPTYDWLLDGEKAKANVYATTDGQSVVLSNGLIARTFRIYPNLATINYLNQMTGENMLRAVSGEGSVQIDGKNYSIGGLRGQTQRGYIQTEWIDDMTPIPNSFIVEDLSVTPIIKSMKWTPKRWALNKTLPTGKSLTFVLRGQGELAKVLIKLHYDLYDGLPTIRKYMEIINESDLPFNLDQFKLEELAFAEPESPVGGDPQTFRLPNICVESNYAFGGFTEKESTTTVKWVTDPSYTSQCNYALQTPCILDVSLPIGPDQLVSRTSPFTSMEVYEMPYDSDDRERKGLFKRHFYRTVTPWLTENPIFMHLISIDPKIVKTAIDQCAEVGYEMIILSFGSGVNMETNDPNHIRQLKELADYAHSKGIEIGGYSLLSSRWISDEVDVINPATGKRGGMIFGSSPCLCSEWGYDYFAKIKSFYEQTGFSVFENDGSYPGNVCASVKHTYHTGLKDSQWKQWKKITELYGWMCEQGIYTNIPDYYFLTGSNKTGIGYREVNWSLPREQQLILGRQVNYAGTYDRLASSCWTFVPLTEYQGGGDVATLEPLEEHIDIYKQHMIQNYGSGIQACYRGPRLYDTPKTKSMVKEVVDWYKRYRVILNRDIIHLRRPDGQDWDGFLHVHPKGKEKGLALFFNPTHQEMTRVITLPLYYTGLTKKAYIRQGEGKPKKYVLDRRFNCKLTVTIPANGYTWMVIE